MEQLLKDLEKHKDIIKLITTGPLFNSKYETIKVTFEQPVDSHVDVVEFSLVIAAKADKMKFAFLMKNATAEFITDLVAAFEEMKMPVAARVHWITDNFDSFLLKVFQWFERYNTVDAGGCTELRYMLREKPAYITRQLEAKKEKVEKKQPTIASQSEKSVSQVKIQEKSEEIPAGQTVNFTVRQKIKPDFKLVSANDFMTLDEWEQEMKEQKPVLVLEEPKHSVRVINLHEKNKIEWLEAHAQAYYKLIRMTNSKCIFSQVLQVAHLFMSNSFQFATITQGNVVFSFDYPFTMLRMKLIKSDYLKVLNEYLKEDKCLNIHVNMNIAKPGSSFVRIDPQGEILSELATFSKKLGQRIEMTHQDVSDRSFLSFASRLLTELLRYQTKQQLIEQLPEHQMTGEDTNVLGTSIIQPPQRRETQQRTVVQQMLLSPMQIEDLIKTLPEPMCNVPLLLEQQEIDLFGFFTNVVPYLLTSVFERAAEQVFQDRVRSYMEAEGYDAADESSSSSEYAEYEEDDEYSLVESSTSSVFEAFSLVRDDFLRSEESDKRGICLKLANFDLIGGLLVQLVQPVISVICTKCLKMMPLTLEPELKKSETGSYQQTNILHGASECPNCAAKVTLTLASQIFNQFTQGECLFVIKHTLCLPVNVGYFSEATMLIQCSACQTLGLHQGLKEMANSNHYTCRCPMCFKQIRLSFSDSFFLLPNGEQLPLPSGILKQQKAKTADKAGPLPDHGVCSHAKRSFRWFRFACGGAFPCDTCHEKVCQCGDKYAKTMLCGFCGRSQAVQDTCNFCKLSVVNKKTSHWEGGRGTRNRVAMSRKDNKKFVGMGKVRSNRDKRKTEDRKRGNQKKKKEE